MGRRKKLFPPPPEALRGFLARFDLHTITIVGDPDSPPVRELVAACRLTKLAPVVADNIAYAAGETHPDIKPIIVIMRKLRRGEQKLIDRYKRRAYVIRPETRRYPNDDGTVTIVNQTGIGVLIRELARIVKERERRYNKTAQVIE